MLAWILHKCTRLWHGSPGLASQALFDSANGARSHARCVALCGSRRVNTAHDLARRSNHPRARPAATMNAAPTVLLSVGASSKNT